MELPAGEVEGLAGAKGRLFAGLIDEVEALLPLDDGEDLVGGEGEVDGGVVFGAEDDSLLEEGALAGLAGAGQGDLDHRLYTLLDLFVAIVEILRQKLNREKRW